MRGRGEIYNRLKLWRDAITTHINIVHAPIDAQKNSDITKEEIEAKLTGQISTHSHAGGNGGYDGDPTIIQQDPTYRFTTDSEKATWNGKQDALGFTPASFDHNHAGIYSLDEHNHDGFYSPINHSHLSTFTLSGDQATGANVTPVTLIGLVFTYAANSKYRIWFMGRISPAAATTGCGFQFDLSSAVTSIDVQFFHQLASTGTLSGGHSVADDASVGVSSGAPGTGNYPVTGHGLLITTSNTGTAQLRFRSETTAIITARAGFTLVVEKIA